jgi:hypothetical protein
VDELIGQFECGNLPFSQRLGEFARAAIGPLRGGGAREADSAISDAFLEKSLVLWRRRHKNSTGRAPTFYGMSTDNGNRYALHALRERRAAIDGELRQCEQRVRHLKEMLGHLDARLARTTMSAHFFLASLAAIGKTQILLDDI